MAHISYEPCEPWLRGRYVVRVSDSPIHLYRRCCTVGAARRTARRLDRLAARHRRRLKEVGA